MTFIIEEDDVLIHYGVLRRSGRYPWGSGGTVVSRSTSFLGMVEDLKKQGFSESEIARSLKIGRTDRNGNFQPSSTDLRALKTIAKEKKKQADTNMALRLKETKGWSTNAIAERMGMPESTIRGLLKNPLAAEQSILHHVSDMLRAEVDSQGLLDIGAGIEYHVGVSETRIKTAIAMLKEEGYVTHNVQVPQLGTNQKTTLKVLAPAGTTYRDIVSDPSKIGSISKHSDDGGRSFLGLKPPENLSSKRLKIVYAEDGGGKEDGVMYLRRGVDDLSLGGKNYAQVRIQVDGTHYLKGMAMYRDDLPKGTDVVFNTSKSNSGNKLDALKELKRNPDGTIDTDNPFGAVIKPGGQKGVLNVVNEEGDWDKWSKSLSSQMLSKQPESLAKAQLDARFKERKTELDEINSLTNPVVRKALLDKFADSADSSAVHLKAASLPGQRTQVILPMNSMRETEIYAPNFKDGTRVALIRYPHGGTFEIPELTVNNRNPTAKKIMGQAQDAVGINHKVAERLSGADFDGDTVLVIPNNNKSVKSSSALEALKGFDARTAYPKYEGMPKLDDRGKQRLMGEVSNLITDMTLQGAHHDEIARAVKHSMVVIDAEKHELDWRQSARDQGINKLKETYQGKHSTGRLKGASTIISRAQSTAYVNERKPRSASKGGPVDPKTGKLVYEETGKKYIVTTVSKKTGKTTTKEVPSTMKVKALSNVDDAYKLTSGGSKKNPGTIMEGIYADHSNRMKDLANNARLASLKTPSIKRSPTAAVVYKPEVDSLKAKLETALKNAPLERKAQVVGNAIVRIKVEANPDLSSGDLKKIKGQALVEARVRVGAKKVPVVIEPREWEAIQAHAVSQNMLSKILNNTDIEHVKALATPRQRTVMTDAKMTRARLMLARGVPQSDIAAALGVPVSTVHEALF